MQDETQACGERGVYLGISHFASTFRTTEAKSSGDSFFVYFVIRYCIKFDGKAKVMTAGSITRLNVLSNNLFRVERAVNATVVTVQKRS